MLYGGVKFLKGDFIGDGLIRWLETETQSEAEKGNLPDLFFELYIFFVRFVDWAVSLS